MIKRLVTLCTLGALAAASASASIGDVPSGTYKLEPTHGYISFSYLHLGFSRPIIGFDTFDVELVLDQENIEGSALSVSVAPASISSRVAEFDEHLKGDKFFDVGTYDQIRFVATEIEMTGENTVQVTGDLTIKDTTKPLTILGTINKAANHPMMKKPTIGISGTGTLLRSDWGLGLYVPNVGDDVTLNLQIELILADS